MHLPIDTAGYTYRQTYGATGAVVSKAGAGPREHQSILAHNRLLAIGLRSFPEKKFALAAPPHLPANRAPHE